MISDSIKECEAKISTLKHIKAFIDFNLKARHEELKEAKEREGVKEK